MKYVIPRSIGLLATAAALAFGHSAGAQTYYGSAQASPQAAPQGTACYPTGCDSSCYNIPTGCALIPNPHPGHGSSREDCIEIHNGCPKWSGNTYHVTHYYEVWYKIKNTDVYYDRIDYHKKPLHRVCSADTPCPSCVEAGGYGKGEHAGTISTPEQVEEMNRAENGAASPSTPASAAPAAAPAQAAAPQKQWIRLTNRQSESYGYGYIGPDGYAVVDPGSERPTLPAPTVEASPNVTANTTAATSGVR